MSRVGQAVAQQEGARIPGATRREMDEIDVPDALWSQIEALA
jgi:(2R)-3-sulfolactate dehydrogenase (NADP+)